METLQKLYEMSALDEMVLTPAYLLMLLIAFLLLYLGIFKKYEPLLLVPIGFGVLLANFPTGDMAVIQGLDTHQSILQIAKEHGIMNMLYYTLIKTGLLPPLIFMGVGAMTDFGPTESSRFCLVQLQSAFRLKRQELWESSVEPMGLLPFTQPTN